MPLMTSCATPQELENNAGGLLFGYIKQMSLLRGVPKKHHVMIGVEVH